MEKAELNQHIQRLLACAEELNKKEFHVFVEFFYGTFEDVNVNARVYVKEKSGSYTEVLYYESLTEDNEIDSLSETILEMEQLAKGAQK